MLDEFDRQNAKAARDWKPSPDYNVTAGGRRVDVHCSEGTSFAVIVCRPTEDFGIEVEVEPAAAFGAAVVRPLGASVEAAAADGKLRLRVRPGHRLSVEPDGDTSRPLLLFVYAAEADAPSPDDPLVHYFRSGFVYEAGEIRLRSGESLYIEEGAVVRGHVVVEDAERIAVRGRGILDGSGWRERSSDAPAVRSNMMKLVRCDGVLVEDVTVVDGETWHIVPVACRNVAVKGANIITFRGTGDGIDIVGSEEVAVSGCFIRSNDDCIAVKAVGYNDPGGCKDVRNVRVSGCVFWNAAWGNALEIGYETSCGVIEHIAFADCDVIRCEFEGWQSGGTFTIHNGDRAIVRDILYENIRVEDSREKLVDIKVLHSKYSRDEERGYIRGIRFRDIRIVDGPFPVSILRGFDESHLIEDVRFEKLSYLGQPLRSANEARMVVELAKGIVFL